MIKKSFSNKTLFSISILLLFSFFPSTLKNSDFSILQNEKILAAENIKFSSVFPLTGEDKEWIENNLEKMTTREKCAQMIMPWVLGKDYADDSLGFARMTHLVKDLKVGGLIFSDGNALNEAIDINKMQAVADIPLLISAVKVLLRFYIKTD